MCVKLPLGDLNPDPYLSDSTSTYIYRMIIAPRVCRGDSLWNSETAQTLNLTNHVPI